MAYVLAALTALEASDWSGACVEAGKAFAVGLAKFFGELSPSYPADDAERIVQGLFQEIGSAAERAAMDWSIKNPDIRTFGTRFRSALTRPTFPRRDLLRRTTTMVGEIAFSTVQPGELNLAGGFMKPRRRLYALDREVRRRIEKALADGDDFVKADDLVGLDAGALRPGVLMRLFGVDRLERSLVASDHPDDDPAILELNKAALELEGLQK